MAAGQHIAQHLHLPVQCGNDTVLHAMNRGYTAQHYLGLVAYARQIMPDIAITSDIIVGFPGESYQQFANTLKLIEQVQFASLFTFIFSPRQGTAAANLPDDVPREEKVRWFTRLTDLQDEIGSAMHAAKLGQTLRVLCEGPGKRLALAGRAAGNQIVEFDGDEMRIGQFVSVKITKATGWHLDGTIV
jgi:tRNA-2-methylthio-N6-dimethylallyladenosine synthase